MQVHGDPTSPSQRKSILTIRWKDWCWSWSSNLMRRANSLEKKLMLGKSQGRRGWQRMKWLDGITDLMDMNLSKLQEIVKDRETWRAAVHGVTKSRTWLSDWIATPPGFPSKGERPSPRIKLQETSEERQDQSGTSVAAWGFYLFSMPGFYIHIHLNAFKVPDMGTAWQSNG